MISHQQIANQIKSTWNQTITNYYAGDGDMSVNYGAVSLFWTATNRYVCTVRLSTVCVYFCLSAEDFDFRSSTNGVLMSVCPLRAYECLLVS